MRIGANASDEAPDGGMDGTHFVLTLTEGPVLLVGWNMTSWPSLAEVGTRRRELVARVGRAALRLRLAGTPTVAHAQLAAQQVYVGAAPGMISNRAGAVMGPDLLLAGELSPSALAAATLPVAALTTAGAAAGTPVATIVGISMAAVVSGALLLGVAIGYRRRDPPSMPEDHAPPLPLKPPAAALDAPPPAEPVTSPPLAEHQAAVGLPLEPTATVPSVPSVPDGVSNSDSASGITVAVPLQAPTTSAQLPPMALPLQTLPFVAASGEPPAATESPPALRPLPPLSSAMWLSTGAAVRLKRPRARRLAPTLAPPLPSPPDVTPTVPSAHAHAVSRSQVRWHRAVALQREGRGGQGSRLLVPPSRPPPPIPMPNTPQPEPVAAPTFEVPAPAPTLPTVEAPAEQALSATEVPAAEPVPPMSLPEAVPVTLTPIERFGHQAERAVAKQCVHVKLDVARRRIELLQPIKFQGSKHGDGAQYKFPRTAEAICKEVSIAYQICNDLLVSHGLEALGLCIEGHTSASINGHQESLEISTKRSSRCERSIKEHTLARNTPRAHADAMWGHAIETLISHRGYGSTQPLPGFDDGENYEENRRVEMRLLEPGEEGYCSTFAAVAARAAPPPGTARKATADKARSSASSSARLGEPSTFGNSAGTFSKVGIGPTVRQSAPPTARPRSTLGGTHHGHCWLRQSPQVGPNQPQGGRAPATAAIALAIDPDGTTTALKLQQKRVGKQAGPHSMPSSSSRRIAPRLASTSSERPAAAVGASALAACEPDSVAAAAAAAAAEAAAEAEAALKLVALRTVDAPSAPVPHISIAQQELQESSRKGQSRRSVAAAERGATEQLNALLGGHGGSARFAASSKPEDKAHRALVKGVHGVLTGVRMGHGADGASCARGGALYTQQSRHLSQWDSLFTLQSAGAATGVSHVVSHCVLEERPLEPGFDGGGGVMLGLMSLNKMDEVQALIVIAGAARKWTQLRDRAMAHKAERAASTLAMLE